MRTFALFAVGLCLAPGVTIQHAAADAAGSRCRLADGSLSGKTVPDAANTDDQHPLGRRFDGTCCLTEYSPTLHGRACRSEVYAAEHGQTPAPAVPLPASAPPAPSPASGDTSAQAAQLEVQARQANLRGDRAGAFALFQQASALGDDLALTNVCSIARGDRSMVPDRKRGDAICTQAMQAFSAASSRNAAVKQQAAQAAVAAQQQAAAAKDASDEAYLHQTRATGSIPSDDMIVLMFRHKLGASAAGVGNASFSSFANNLAAAEGYGSTEVGRQASALDPLMNAFGFGGAMQAMGQHLADMANNSDVRVASKSRHEENWVVYLNVRVHGTDRTSQEKMVLTQSGGYWVATMPALMFAPH